MKKLFALIVTVVSTITFALADPVRLYTVPRGPSREVLDRLSLTQGWRTRISLESRRDGIFSLQILPDKVSPQVAVQTLSGSVLLFDGETGDLLWRTAIGQPYWSAQPVGYNSSSIFATRRNRLHVLSRRTGQERLYDVDKDSKLPIFGMSLPLVPSAAPTADDEVLTLSFGQQVTGYRLPIFEEDERLRNGEAKGNFSQPSLQPEFAWNYRTAPMQIETSPIIALNQLGVVATDGTFLSINKYQGHARYTYKFPGAVSAAMGQHGYNAYIGSEDSTVYALDMRVGQLLWRMFANGPVLKQPEVTDRDVFVVAARTGLYRVDRQLGEEVWLNRSAAQFLGTNQQFVYALDPRGFLLILDYQRGTTLASYDMSDWTVAVANDRTDRIYFASHDGQVLCLHHRDQRKPLNLKTFASPAAKVEEKAKDEKKEMKEPEEKAKEPEEKKEEKVKEKEEKKEKVGRGAGSVERGTRAEAIAPWCHLRFALHVSRFTPRTARSAFHASRIS